MSQTGRSCITRNDGHCIANFPPSTSHVFIIGPNSDEFSADIAKIADVLRGFGLEPYFATKSEKEAGEEVFCNKICKNILESYFCVVLLNDPVVHQCPVEQKPIRASRPNVYYEYGLAIAFGKKTIPIIRKDLPMPFDIQHLQITTYEKDNLDDLDKKLKNAVRGTIEKIAEQKERLTYETQLAQNAETNPITEKLDGRRNDALIGGLISLFLMTFLPLLLGGFWIFGSEISSWIFSIIFIFSCIFSSILIVFRLILAHRFTDKLTRVVQRITVPYLLIYGLFDLALVIISSMVFLYPVTTGDFFVYTWQYFFFLSIGIFGVILLISGLVHLYLIRYSSTTENQNYEPNAKVEFAHLKSGFKHYLKLIQKKLPITIIITTFCFASIVIPLDLNFTLFTPSYRNDEETFSHAFAFQYSDEYYLFLYSNWTLSNTTLQYGLYRLVQTQYTIYPARIASLSNNISIPNPTNITLGTTQQPLLPRNGFNWRDRSEMNLGPVYVNSSKNIKIDFFPKIENFTQVHLDLTGISEPVTVNFTYWKRLDANVNVTVYKPEYINLGNGSTLEKYTYLISNNEEIPVTIRTLDFDRLDWGYSDGINANSTIVYLNGHDWYSPQAPAFAEEYRILNIEDPHVYRDHPLNLTLTFQSSFKPKI